MSLKLLDSLSRAAGRTAGGTIPSVPATSKLPGDYIKNVLDMADGSPEYIRLQTDGYFHVSSLVDFCPRAVALMLEENRSFTRRVTGGHRVMWSVGRAVEKHIRTQYIESRGPENVLGNWTCKCGSERLPLNFRRDHRCVTCGGQLLHYEELALRDPTHKIVGSPDIVVKNHNTLVVVEIKSKAKHLFDKLNGPDGDHIFQAGMYHDLLQLAGYTVHPEVVIIYCNKDFQYGSPYKEEHVDVTRPQYVEHRDYVRSALRDLFARQAVGMLPRRIRCQDISSPTAKKCPVMGSCFSRQTD